MDHGPFLAISLYIMIHPTLLTAAIIQMNFYYTQDKSKKSQRPKHPITHAHSTLFFLNVAVPILPAG